MANQKGVGVPEGGSQVVLDQADQVGAELDDAGGEVDEQRHGRADAARQVAEAADDVADRVAEHADQALALPLERKDAFAGGVLPAAAAEEVLGATVAVNMRVGGSDARWFRMLGLPTVVYGPTPHNMGGADEWADIAELEAVAQVHALAAFDFLAA